MIGELPPPWLSPADKVLWKQARAKIKHHDTPLVIDVKTARTEISRDAKGRVESLILFPGAEKTDRTVMHPKMPVVAVRK